MSSLARLCCSCMRAGRRTTLKRVGRAGEGAAAAAAAGPRSRGLTRSASRSAAASRHAGEAVRGGGGKGESSLPSVSARKAGWGGLGKGLYWEPAQLERACSLHYAAVCLAGGFDCKHVWRRFRLSGQLSCSLSACKGEDIWQEPWSGRTAPFMRFLLSAGEDI